MFGNNKQTKRNSDIDSLVGSHTKIKGDIHFSGGLHIDGTIVGNVVAETENSMLTTSENCRIEGDVKVHHIVLNGEVVGDVHALEHVELAANARVTGNVYYKVIEMMMGAEVNGSLIHVVDNAQQTASNSATGKEPSANGKDPSARGEELPLANVANDK